MNDLDRSTGSSRFIVSLLDDLKAFREHADRKNALGKLPAEMSGLEWRRVFIEYLSTKYGIGGDSE